MKPSSDRGSAGPTRAGAGRRAAAGLALALLDAGCGSDDVSSPVAPTAPDPVVPTLVSIEIANAPPAGLIVGNTVRLAAHGTYSDGTTRLEVAAWTSSDPVVASVAEDGEVQGHAVGACTITATVGDHHATADVDVLPIPPVGADEAFWRQFAFNDWDCRTRGTCEAQGFTYRPIEERLLWRLPTPSPDFLVLADSLSPEIVDRIRETIPHAVPQLSENTAVASVVMKAVKMSVSFERALGDRIRSAARRSGTGISSWLAAATAARLRADALRQFLDEWEAENGALTTDELRRAEAELGPSDGGEPAVAPSTRRPRRAPARR